MPRDLNAAEIAELTDEQAAGISLPDNPDEVRSYTAAEVALLEEEGFEAEEDATYATLEQGAAHVAKALTLTRGAKSIKVEVVDSSAHSDRVNLYDTVTGYPFPIPRSLLRFYLDKPRANGERVFSVKQLVKPPERTVPCKATVCKEDGRRSMFVTEEEMEGHWQIKHSADWQRRERRFARADSERSNAILEGIMRSTMANRTEMSTEDIAALNEAAEKAAAQMVPNDTWSKGRIIAWMETHEMPFTPVMAQLTKGQLLEKIGVVDPIEELVAV
jgi:hypothetical protein